METQESPNSRPSFDELCERALDESAPIDSAPMDNAAQIAAEQERAALRAQLDELTRQREHSRQVGDLRRQLAAQGIAAPDELLAVLVSDDAEKTERAAAAFTQLFRQAVERTVRDKLRGSAPRAGMRSGSRPTKQQIAAIRDPAARQQAIVDNKDLFGL